MAFDLAVWASLGILGLVLTENQVDAIFNAKILACIKPVLTHLSSITKWNSSSKLGNLDYSMFVR